MTERLHLELLVPSKVMLSDYCYEINLPGGEGRFAILAGHMNYMAQLKPGFLKIKFNQDSVYSNYFVSEGVAQVQNNQCIILVEKAIEENNSDIAKFNLKIHSIKVLLEQENLPQHKKDQLLKELQFYDTFLNT